MVALVASASLLAAACGSGSDTDSASSAGTAPATTEASTAASAPADTAAGGGATTTMAMDMELPEYASAMKVEATSPSADGVLTGNELEVSVVATGFELTCAGAGKPLAEGQGHYHLLLDGSLIDMKCTPTATISMQNVSPGPHEVEVVPALNDHAEVMDNMQKISFDYQPTSPLAEITDAAPAGEPTIKIVSPKPGDVVSGEFDVVVETTNFTLSEDLYGKPGLVGYGHWHANLDTATGPMMGMMTMMGMSGTNTFKATTDGLKPGDTHSVIAILVDNGHAPFPTMISDEVEVTVG